MYENDKIEFADGCVGAPRTSPCNAHSGQRQGSVLKIFSFRHLMSNTPNFFCEQQRHSWASYCGVRSGAGDVVCWQHVPQLIPKVESFPKKINQDYHLGHEKLTIFWFFCLVSPKVWNKEGLLRAPRRFVARTPSVAYLASLQGNKHAITRRSADPSVRSPAPQITLQISS